MATVATAQTARIVLRWKEVPGATGYELQIAKDSAFVEMVLQTRTPTAGYRWEQLPSATHWWRVRSFDAEGRPSEWSAPRTLAVDAAVPLPVSPADGERLPCGATVTLTLEGSQLLKEYVVLLGPTADLAGAKELRGKTPGFSVPALAAGTWYWQAKGVDLRGRTSSAAPVRSFVVQVPAPRVSPVGDAVVGSVVTLAWSAAVCAQSYVAEASVDGRERTSLPSSGTSLAFKPGSPGDYRWRVAGRDGAGGLGEWSPESSFRVRLPAPAGREEVAAGRAALSWSAVPGAASYRVELSARPDFKPPAEVQATTVAGTSWRSGELAPGAWQWRVVARDAAGHTSLPSEVRRFAVSGKATLAAPELVVPAAGAVVSSGEELEVSWTPVATATRYEVELDGQALPVVQAPTTRLAPLAEGDHQLRVRALAEAGRESPFGPLRGFSVGLPAVERAVVEQVGSEVRVRLEDARGRPVTDARPRFAARAGALSAAELRDGRWVMRWTPPGREGDVLLITERAFRGEHPLSAPTGAWWAVGAVGGATFNGGALASPSAVAFVARQLPALDERLAVELRLGVARGATRTGAEAAWLVPVSLLAAWRQDAGGVTLGAAVGPVLQVAFLQAGAAQEVRVLPGVEASLSAARRLGPGSLLLEVAFLYARLEAPVPLLNAGGISARVGYALSLGDR